MGAVTAALPAPASATDPGLVRSGGDARFLKTGRLWSTWPPSGDRRTVSGQQVFAVAAATAGGRSLS
jgi:hypothetical protein